MAYIADYVFDGTSPPYPPSATPHPINSYGQSKRDGELAVLEVTGLRSVVLRVPVLCVSNCALFLTMRLSFPDLDMAPLVATPTQL